MRYDNIVNGIFIKRLNRFTATVMIDGTETYVHVKNTGRLGELLLEGARVSLQKADNPSRKTGFDLIGVYRDGTGWVNVDSQISNALVRDWLGSGSTPFGKLDLIRPEYTYGSSRIDIYAEKEGRRILMEVKGCTLEREGTGLFPDAPTERGSKHLRELSGAVKEGYEAYIAFVIAVPGPLTVRANEKTDPSFSRELENARSAGVRTIYLPCAVTSDSIEIINDKVRTD